MFGTGGSIAVVATAMVLFAAAMPVIVLAPRLGRKVLLAAVVAVSLASACLGVIAYATLLTEPGMGFVLLYGCPRHRLSGRWQADHHAVEHRPHLVRC